MKRDLTSSMYPPAARRQLFGWLMMASATAAYWLPAVAECRLGGHGVDPVESKTVEYTAIAGSEDIWLFRRSVFMLGVIEQRQIENRRWRIARYRADKSSSSDKDGMITATEPAEVAFINGQVHGSPGCGAWVGTYRLSGDSLTSDVDTALAGLCSSKQSKQAYFVQKALKGERRIESIGSNILLRDNNGIGMILLVPS